MMVEIVKELEKTLDEIKPPTFAELKIASKQRKGKGGNKGKS